MAPIAPERQAMVTVDGVGLAYCQRGQGRPLVFLHGLAACSASWRAVAAILSAGYRCISLDLMGFGRSDRPVDESYTLERQAELLRRFLVELALEDAVLIGHSYGGGVCLLALREGCDRVGGLVLVDSICYPQAAPLPLRVVGWPVLGPLALRLAPKAWAVATVFGSAYGTRAAPAAEVVAANALALASPGGRYALVQTVRELRRRPAEPITDYGRVRLPALLIWGGRDAWVPPALGRRLATEVPGAQLVVLDECGHLPQEEAPQETAEAIARFLRLMPAW